MGVGLVRTPPNPPLARGGLGCPLAPASLRLGKGGRNGHLLGKGGGFRSVLWRFYVGLMLGLRLLRFCCVLLSGRFWGFLGWSIRFIRRERGGRSRSRRIGGWRW